MAGVAGRYSLPPKCLTDGSDLKAKFANRPSESVQQFLTEIETQLEPYEPAYWIRLTQRQLGKDVLQDTINEGRTREYGRMDDPDSPGSPCPAGWFNWQEFKEYLKERFKSPFYETQGIEKALFGMSQKTSLTNYVTGFDLQLANIETCIPCDAKKAILLHHMKPEVRERIFVQPHMIDFEYKKFCHHACMIDDSLFRSQKTPYVPKKAPQRGVGAVNDGGTVGAVQPGDFTRRGKGKNNYVNPFIPAGEERFKDAPLDFCFACRGTHCIKSCPRCWKYWYPDKPMPAHVKANIKVVSALNAAAAGDDLRGAMQYELCDGPPAVPPDIPPDVQASLVPHTNTHKSFDGENVESVCVVGEPEPEDMFSWNSDERLKERESHSMFMREKERITQKEREKEMREYEMQYIPLGLLHFMHSENLKDIDCEDKHDLSELVDYNSIYHSRTPTHR